MSHLLSFAGIGLLWPTVLILFLCAIACLLYAHCRKLRALKARINELEAENKTINSLARQDERSCIASNLHDGIGAELSLLKLKLSRYAYCIKNNLRFKSENFMNDLKQLDNTINTVRDVCHELHSGEFTEKKLLESCQNFAGQLNDSGYMQCSFYSNLQESDLSLTADSKKTLFLVYLEVMNNIMRHAKCQNLHVALSLQGETLRLLFTHNGMRFTNLDAGIQMAENKGIGLSCINKRLRLLSGHINYLSENNQQLVAVTLPASPARRNGYRRRSQAGRRMRQTGQQP